MKKLLTYLIAVSLLAGCSVFAEDTTVSEIKCDYKINPTGIGKTPNFSWILSSKLKNQKQTSYHVLVADEMKFLDDNIGTIWDSEVVSSNKSINIKFNGQDLEAGKEYFWKVKVWDKNGMESNWSNPGKFVTSLFDENDWHGAKWIACEEMNDSLFLVPGVHPWQKDVKHLAQRRPVIPYFRKEFETNKEVKSAYIFITGLGHYKAFMNGEQISDDFLSPGWTDYIKTCLYNTYDIIKYIKKGKNAVGAIVGNGFHNINNERYRKLLITYGMPKMIARIVINYTDGTHEIIVTDESWKSSPSPVTFCSLYGGESYDARLEQEGWNRVGFNDESWSEVYITQSPGGTLRAEKSFPVKVNEIFKPVEYFMIDADSVVYDFGQNASGIVRVKVRGKKGQTIILKPGELIKEDKHINQKFTGSPYYYEYTLKGDEDEVYQPMFTLYGLRYVQIENAVPGGKDNDEELPEIIDVEFLHTCNSAPRTGKFSCSNDLFNAINKLILYAIQSNTQSVLTDCVHREKLGWLEQTHLMGNSIHYNIELYHLYKKLIQDMIDAQEEDGLIPNIAPEFVSFGKDMYEFTDSPEWGSAGIILPYLIYKWYGDISVIYEAWPMMNRYLDYLKSKADNYILMYGLSDWYDVGPELPGYCQLSPMGLTATAIFYYDAGLMAEMASLINKSEESRQYELLAENIKKSFNKKYFNKETKVYGTGSQTSYAMPYSIGLVADEDREMVIKNLIDSINANNKALTAGDIGFHYLIEALMMGGASQLIYEMNNRDDVPGYGYQIKKGATALTESWEALERKSNNHLMLGHIMEWFYKGLGGIQQSEHSVAYNEIVINPTIAGDITNVKTCFNSPYGLIKSNWELKNNCFNLDVSIPVNTTAKIHLPATKSDDAYENGVSIKELNDIEIIEEGAEGMVLKVGSGNYRFSVTNYNL
ncbi:MAG: family 78 glycoside hydrolase catalytic domain [Sedimentisphaerales bacterium]|nr:family 78 glycoside hydrolase catalytic domain [Sedimentisphaerales bacterium]